VSSRSQEKSPVAASGSLGTGRREVGAVKYTIYQLDSFAGARFRGNPAAIVLLDRWLDDDVLLAIAAENNLSETGFLVRGPENLELRWFTPLTEVDLCGHATLATGYVMLSIERLEGDSVEFSTKSGTVSVLRYGELLALDFPSRPGRQVDVTDELVACLGARPEVVLESRDVMAVFATEEEVLALKPRFDLMSGLDKDWVMATAPAARADYCYRFFGPKMGVDEDPATGSAQCMLVPYWAGRLGKDRLSSLQHSRRGGEFLCESKGERVLVCGRVAEYLRGEIEV
jgi:predicted PhzF superfamily epimerase YddE/YHI9